MRKLNEYKIMWIFVFFDLPTETKTERKGASDFRKNLISDGFIMYQFSVYLRHCSSYANAEVHTKRVQKLMPPLGQVSILSVTDKQFGMMKNFFGNKPAKQPTLFDQLELF